MARPRRWVRFLRNLLATRQGWLCYYCNEPMVPIPKDGRRLPPNMVTLDHKIPRSAGGETSLSNCVAACQACNCAKGDGAEPARKGEKDE